nr:hypothetical protein [uncultured Mucilaginibacter sp.]
MKRICLVLALSLLIFASCSSTKKLAGVSVAQDGSSYKTAIVITETHEQQGIDAEYAWLRAKYPDYKARGQSLSNQDKKPYDIIHITTAEGKDLDVYFDISNFFGKF